MSTPTYSRMWVVDVASATVGFAFGYSVRMVMRYRVAIRTQRCLQRYASGIFISSSFIQGTLSTCVKCIIELTILQKDSDKTQTTSKAVVAASHRSNSSHPMIHENGSYSVRTLTAVPFEFLNRKLRLILTCAPILNGASHAQGTGNCTQSSCPFQVHQLRRPSYIAMTSKIGVSEWTDREELL